MNEKIKQKANLEISAEDLNWIADRPERLDEWVAKKATEELNREIIETHQAQRQAQEEARQRQAADAIDPYKQSERLLQ